MVTDSIEYASSEAAYGVNDVMYYYVDPLKLSSADLAPVGLECL
jgi:hypothetical protein